MSSVSPDSSISQLVSTTGGIVVEAPSRELLEKLEPSTAARLLLEYYAAVVACSGGRDVDTSVTSSSTSRSSRSRMGKRERRLAVLQVAEQWRAKEGYCYTKLLADSSVARCAAAMGPDITLARLCEVPASDAGTKEQLAELRVSYSDGVYHVSSDGSESIPDLFRRCASASRGRTGQIMHLFGTAAFGSPTVKWDAIVGSRVARGQWVSSFGNVVSGYTVEAPAAPDSPLRVVFPSRVEDVELRVAKGMVCSFGPNEANVEGPAWVFVGKGKPFSVLFTPVHLRLASLWGSARLAVDLPDRRSGGLPPDGVYKHVNWGANLSNIADYGLDVSVVAHRRDGVYHRVDWQVVFPRNIVYTCVNSLGSVFSDFDGMLMFARVWQDREGIPVPVAFDVRDGEVIAARLGTE